MGWDFFYGDLEAAPRALDSTAGGVAAPGTYTCGFVTDAAFGACRFSDDTCTTEIQLVGVFNFDDPCAPPPPTYARIEGADACTAGVQIFHLGPAYTGPVYVDLGGTCEPDFTPPELLTYYTLGAEIPPAGMVELSRVIDGG